MASPTVEGINYAGIAIGLLGGLSIFLFGMEQMTGALKTVAGDGMRTLLRRLTGNRFTAAFTGAFVTAVIQSSSVTTVLVVGFISAGLMSLQQSVGVIMGANIGTTVTAQIIAFKVTEYALVLVTLGFAMLFVSKRDTIRQTGGMIMGLGLIFFGMALMSDATYPLRSFDPFIEFMQRMDNPILAMLVAAGFTALVQSSSATTGIVIVLASQGFITLEAGIALALGANIGTCVTALLATLGKTREALQAALVHVIFNVVGAAVWVGLIGYLAELVREISPTFSDLEGVDRLARETPRQIANAHTLFNVINTLVFIWFTGTLAKFVQFIAPVRPAKIPERAKARYLDEAFLDTPALAIDRVRMEIGRLGTHVHELVESTEQDGDVSFEPIERAVADAEALEACILGYARRISTEQLSSTEARRLEGLLAIAGHVLSIADTVGLNLATIAREWRARRITASAETRRMFAEFQAMVAAQIGGAVVAVRDDDVHAAREVAEMKPRIGEAADALARRLSERLLSEAPNRIDTYRLESEAIEVFKRLYYFAKRVARLVVEQNEQEPSAEDEQDR